jgi:hypothetical protein
MTQAPPPADMRMQRSSRDASTVPTVLADWLAPLLPTGAEPGVTLHSGVDANGMSSETMLLDVDWTEGGEPRHGEYVARVAPAAADFPVFPTYELQDRYDAMRIVAEASDVPVPAVRWMEPTGEVLGTPFFLMDRVVGLIPQDVLPYHGSPWTPSGSRRSGPGRGRSRSMARTSPWTRTAGSAPATGRGGVRPVGEAEPQGRPADPPFEGMWWLYVPLRFDDFAVILIMQEDPSGHRVLNDCTRVWKDGRVEQLGWPLVTIRHASGTRVPTGASIRCTTPDGKPLDLEVESRLAVPLHVGGGYGGDSDRTHGMWKGPGFTERRTYDLTADDVAGRVMFGVIDHVGRATCDAAEGWGLFEHGAIGRHDPSGFADFFTLAP